MSVEDFKGFGKTVAESEEYRAKAKEIGIDNIDGLIGFGKEIGYEFDADDIQAYAAEIGSQTEELSEEDLEKVAGGIALGTVAAICAVVAIGVSAIAAGGALATAAASITKEW